MVNRNVIRGGGLIILAGCYIAVERVFTNNVVNDAKQLYVGLIGAGRGSMYNVSHSMLSSPPLSLHLISHPSFVFFPFLKDLLRR